MSWLINASRYRGMPTIDTVREYMPNEISGKDPTMIYQSSAFPHVFLGSCTLEDMQEAADLATQYMREKINPEDFIRFNVAAQDTGSLDQHFPNPYFSAELPEAKSDTGNMMDENMYSLAQQQFNDTADILAKTIKSTNRPVYVHCALGMNRSAAVLAAALTKITNQSIVDILREMKGKRFVVAPHDAYFLMAVQYSQNEDEDWKRQMQQRLDLDKNIDFRGKTKFPPKQPEFVPEKVQLVANRNNHWLFKLAAADIYWLPAQQSQQYPVGKELFSAKVYGRREAAERSADGDLYYLKPSMGHPTVYPVQISKLIGRSQWSTIADVTITGPPELTEKAKKLADKNQYLKLFNLHGYTSGFHGYGDTPEYPAGNPREAVDWDPEVLPETFQAIDRILKGSTIILAGGTDGSYHEQWFNGGIYISVSFEQEDKLREIEPDLSLGRVDDNHKIVTRLPFVSMAKTIEAAVSELDLNVPENIIHMIPQQPNIIPEPKKEPQKEPIDPAKIQPGETSQEFWDRQVKWRTIGKYDPKSGD